MEKPYLNTANLSSKRIRTQPSTLLPYFSSNKGIREGGIVAVATKGAVGNKGFGIRFVDNSNLNRCLTSFALQTSFDMTAKFFEKKSGVLRCCRKTPLFPPHYNQSSFRRSEATEESVPISCIRGKTTT